MTESEIKELSEALATKLRELTTQDGWTLQKYAEEIANAMKTSAFPTSVTINAPRKMKFRVTVDTFGQFTVAEVP